MVAMVKVQVHTPTGLPMMRIDDTTQEARVRSNPFHEVVEVTETEARQMLSPAVEGSPAHLAADIRLLRSGLS